MDLKAHKVASAPVDPSESVALTPENSSRLAAYIRILLDWDERRHRMDALHESRQGADGDDANQRPAAGRFVREGLEQGPGA